MKVAVIGGAGYIGSFTVRSLVESGHTVSVFDNLSFGHAAAVHRDAELVRGSLENPAELEGFFQGRAFDALVHFAALTSVPDSVRDPLRYYNANVALSVQLFTAMRKAGVNTALVSSTAATYGVPLQDRALDEEHPTNPTNPYGETKLAMESMLRATVVSDQINPSIAAEDRFRAVALRYFNACGASEDGLLGEDHRPETHLMPNAVRAALGVGASLKLFGNDYPTPDGTCVRDYIHVEDLARAHVMALEALFARRLDGFQVFNVGTGQGASNLEIIEAAGEAAGRPVPYSVEPRRPGDPPELVADSTRLQQTLGWKPRYTSIRQIAETVVRWYKGNPDGYPD
ncbi:MAG: UDP-glucose 4-epimerase GalE [Oligoflexia bacterium]|nr:UDP-glucose 4-epimerase GalE [Oligoflexia bacterium]